MKAVCWKEASAVEVRNVPSPELLNPRDAIVRVRATTICGSDLHLYNGYLPTMARGDVMGHEFMGEVVEVGPGVRSLRAGDRVVVPSVISCGECFYCQRRMFSLCDNSNPNARLPEQAWGHAPCGIFGCSHMTGGYPGSFAQYVRVPFADVGPRKVPDGVTDAQALFISDAFPTGFMGADFCDLQGGETVAVWGCGAVGQFAIRSAYLLGAERVIAIDRIAERLELAQSFGQAEVLDASKVNVAEALRELTGGRGPDACIEAVGLEDPPSALREAIVACGKGGVVSVLGEYSGVIDTFPMGAAMKKGLTFRMGQIHAQRYMDRLIGHVQRGEVDPSRMVTHRMTLDDAPRAFDLFHHKKDRCVRVMFEA